MPRVIFSVSVFFLLAVLSGCSSSPKKDIKFQHYTEDRERVDTQVEGNAGYLYGTPPPEAVEGVTDTRRFYMFEFTKKNPPEVDIEEDISYTSTTERVESRSTSYSDRDDSSSRTYPVREKSTNFSTQKTVSRTVSTNTVTFEDYIVQKNDTLQKISKQFYDSYSKWPKIYEANKDKIADPNRIKPGITLRIPTE